MTFAGIYVKFLDIFVDSLSPPISAVHGRPTGTATVHPPTGRSAPAPTNPLTRGLKTGLTSVVNVKLVDDALVAASEDHHEVLDGHSPVSVPRSRRRSGGISYFFPL
jgi:hypothetical protein